MEGVIGRVRIHGHGMGEHGMDRWGNMGKHGETWDDGWNGEKHGMDKEARGRGTEFYGNMGIVLQLGWGFR